MWPFILTLISAVLFFGFVAFCWVKFGLQSCYSAYGPLWAKTPPFSWTFNPWSLVTMLVALILIPAIIESAEGSAWQFTAFLCPACIAFVALTPDYVEGGTTLKVHLVCAATAALWGVLYIIFCATSVWWLIPTYLVLAGGAILYFGKWSWNYWLEMAAFLMVYTAMIVMTWPK